MKMILNLKNFNLKHVKALYFCCRSRTEKNCNVYSSVVGVCLFYYILSMLGALDIRQMLIPIAPTPWTQLSPLNE